MSRGLLGSKRLIGDIADVAMALTLAAALFFVLLAPTPLISRHLESFQAETAGDGGVIAVRHVHLRRGRTAPLPSWRAIERNPALPLASSIASPSGKANSAQLRAGKAGELAGGFEK